MPSRPARATREVDESDTPVAFWALVAFTGVLLVAPQTYWAPLASLSLAKVAAVGAVITHVFANLSRGRPILRWSTPLRFAALLLGWTVVTIPFAVWPGGAMLTLSSLYLKSLIIFWVLGSVVASLGRLRQIFWSLVLFTLPLPITTILRFRSAEFLTESRDVPRIVGYDAPLTTNPNDLALMLNLVLPLTVSLVSTTRHRVLKLFLLVVIALDVIGVLLTFSRGGFLALAAMAGVYCVRALRTPRRRWALAVLPAGLLCLMLMPASYATRLSTIWHPDEDITGSAQARRIQTYAAIAYTLQHPLVGAGLGLDANALVGLGGTWHTVHNVWLQYSADLGLPGVVLFASLYISALRTVRAARHAPLRHPDSRALSAFSEALELSLLAFGASTVFYPVAYHFYFYYIAGLAVAVGHLAQTSRATCPESPHRPPVITAFAPTRTASSPSPSQPTNPVP